MQRLAIVVALVATTRAVSAQPAGAQAEVLFRHGRELLAAGKLAEACAAFQESQRLEPAVTTLVNLAGCREQNHELATAWGLFLDAERQTRAATDPAGKQLHGIAHDRAQALEPRVSKLTINVPAHSRIHGLEIRRDAATVEPVVWNRALPVDGGTYTIEAHAPGTKPWSTHVTVGVERDTKTVEIPELVAVPKRPDDEASEASDASDASEPATEPAPHAYALAITVSGGAVAAFGGAVAFKLWGDANYRDAKAELVDQARRNSLYSSANTKRHVALGLGATGIVAASVAVWLFVRGGSTTRDEPTTTFVVSPHGVGLAGAF